MAMPTESQILDAIAAQIVAVGDLNVSVYEVALTLDWRLPGLMTDDEFARLQIDIQPQVEQVRTGAMRRVWGA